MHYYAVFLVALKAGRSAEEAWELAYWSAYPDVDNDLDAISQAYRNGLKLWGRGKPRMKRIQSGFHQLSGFTSKENLFRRQKLLGMISRQNIPRFQGPLIHAFADTFGHLKITPIVETVDSGFYDEYGNSITYSHVVNWETGGGTYSPGLGHAGDGYDPDLVALRPQLAKDYLEELFKALGGNDVARLDDMKRTIDDLHLQQTSGKSSPKDLWKKDVTARQALNAFKKMAEDTISWKSLPSDKRMFNPESKQFYNNRSLSRKEKDYLLEFIEQ